MILDAYVEMAELFKSRDNPDEYSPVFGTVTALPELEIRVGDRVVLDADDIVCTFDIYGKTVKEDGTAVYTYLNKTVVLLPYARGQRFAAIGAIV